VARIIHVDSSLQFPDFIFKIKNWFDLGQNYLQPVMSDIKKIVCQNSGKDRSILTRCLQNLDIICVQCAQCLQAAYLLRIKNKVMKQKREEKTAYRAAYFFERFGVGEHLEHPSFAMGDCDFEGID
jgi:hypothetical protein